MRARKPLASTMGMRASVGRERVFSLSQVRQFFGIIKASCYLARLKSENQAVGLV
jgi:hypothetical protein